MTEKKSTRRGFLTVVATAVVVGVIAGVGGYYAGLLSAPPGGVTTTTVTSPGPGTTTTVSAPPTTRTVTAPPVTTTITEKPTSPRTIRIGGSIAMTGPLGTLTGPIYNDWMKAYERVTNEEGGVYVEEYDARLPIEVFVYDDGSSPDKSVELHEKLVNADKIDIAIGPFNAGIALRASTVTEKYGIPMIGAESSSISLWERDFDYFVAVSGLMYYWSEYYFNMIKDYNERGLTNFKTMVVLYEDEPWAGDVQSGAAERGKAIAGLETLSIEKVPFPTSDFTSVIIKFKQLNPDIVYCPIHSQEPFFKQAKEMGLNPWEMHFCPPSKYTITNIGALSEGLTSEVQAPPRSFDKKYWKILDILGVTDPYDLAEIPLRYLGMETILNAIYVAGTLDKAKLRDTIHDLRYSSIAGPIYFNWDYEFKGKKLGGFSSKPQWPIQVQEGTIRVVWPPEDADATYRPPTKRWGT